jgi:hypothetical protein
VPPEPLLDIKLDHILASASPDGYVSETAKGIKLLGDAIGGFIKVVRDTLRSKEHSEAAFVVL